MHRIDVIIFPCTTYGFLYSLIIYHCAGENRSLRAAEEFYILRAKWINMGRISENIRESKGVLTEMFVRQNIFGA